MLEAEEEIYFDRKRLRSLGFFLDAHGPGLHLCREKEAVKAHP